MPGQVSSDERVVRGAEIRRVLETLVAATRPLKRSELHGGPTSRTTRGNWWGRLLPNLVRAGVVESDYAAEPGAVQDRRGCERTYKLVNYKAVENALDLADDELYVRWIARPPGRRLPNPAAAKQERAGQGGQGAPPPAEARVPAKEAVARPPRKAGPYWVFGAGEQPRDEAPAQVPAAPAPAGAVPVRLSAEALAALRVLFAEGLL